MTSENDLNTPAIALIGFIGAIVVFAVIVLLMVVFYRVQAEQEFEKDVSQAYEQVGKLTADQRGRLASYGWVNQEKGIARIPVSRAMELVTAELSRNANADVIGVPPAGQPPLEAKPKEGQPKPAPGKPKEKSDAPQP